MRTKHIKKGADLLIFFESVKKKIGSSCRVLNAAWCLSLLNASLLPATPTHTLVGRRPGQRLARPRGPRARALPLDHGVRARSAAHLAPRRLWRRDQRAARARNAARVQNGHAALGCLVRAIRECHARVTSRAAAAAPKERQRSPTQIFCAILGQK